MSMPRLRFDFEPCRSTSELLAGNSRLELKASLLYRIASVLLLRGHTRGFRMTDPKLGVSPLIASLQTRHFQIQGSNRTFWDFYVGFGLFMRS